MISNGHNFNPFIVLFRYRKRLIEGVRHDIRQQYSGSVLGAFWTFIFPLLQLSIYAGLYTVVFRVRPSGLTEFGYTLLVFSGLVPLLAFSQAVVAATNALNTNKSLLLNTVFPAELIPLRALLCAQAPMLIGLGLTVIFGYALGRTGWEALILVPVFWILLIMFAAGIGWILSLASLIIRDIPHSIGLILMLVTVLSPFAYTPDMVPEALKFILYVNPLSYYVLSFQKFIAYGVLPDFFPALMVLILSVGSFLGGFYMFQRTRYIFFDYA